MTPQLMLEQWQSACVIMAGADVGMANNCLNCTVEMWNVNNSSTDDGLMTVLPQHIIPWFDANVLAASPCDPRDLASADGLNRIFPNLPQFHFSAIPSHIP